MIETEKDIPLNVDLPSSLNIAEVPLFVPEIVSALTKQRQEHWCLRAIFTKIVQAVTMGHQETVQDTQMPTLSLHQISNMENNLIASVSLRISIAKAFVNYSAY